MRYFLGQQGHYVEGWAQGFNTGGRGLISDIAELSDKWDVDRDKARQPKPKSLHLSIA